MKLFEDILSTINTDAIVRDVRQGSFHTAVLSHKCGLAATPHEARHDHDSPPVTDAGEIIGRNAMKLAHFARSAKPFETSIGMATINSLLNVDLEHCLDLNGGDLLSQKGKGKKTALVGHFPFASKLRQEAKCLWVIEIHPMEGDLPENDASHVIPQAEVIGITGSAFINHTIEHLLALCSPESYVIVLGPTTPMSPVLFDYGVNAISGILVTDPDVVLRYISQGATFRQFKGIRLVTMERDRHR